MKKSFLALTTILFSVLFLTGCQNTETTPSSQTATDALMEQSLSKEEEAKESPEQKMKELQAEEAAKAETGVGKEKEASQEPNGNISMIPINPPLYKEYNEAEFAALKGQEPVVLFFYAAWCSECRALDTKLNENLNRFPEKTIIFKVDYDKETELKKEYGITVQTTFIILDYEGKVSDKLTNPSIEKLQEALNKTL